VRILNEKPEAEPPRRFKKLDPCAAVAGRLAGCTWGQVSVFVAGSFSHKKLGSDNQDRLPPRLRCRCGCKRRGGDRACYFFFLALVFLATFLVAAAFFAFFAFFAMSSSRLGNLINVHMPSIDTHIMKMTQIFRN
jgi:hypothetical protein